MSGQELRELAESAGLSPVEVSRAADISDETLRKVYRDIHVKKTTRVKVEQAIHKLSAKMKQAVAG